MRKEATRELLGKWYTVEVHLAAEVNESIITYLIDWTVGAPTYGICALQQMHVYQNRQIITYLRSLTDAWYGRTAR